MRAFGKDRARETQAPARSILAAVPTPLGPPVGCHPTPSDGIAHAIMATHNRKGKGLNVKTEMAVGICSVCIMSKVQQQHF